MRISPSPAGRSRRRVLTALTVVMVGIGASLGIIYNVRAQQDVREDSVIAPGLTMSSCIRQLPPGPLRFWVITADVKQGWDLGLELADDEDAVKKRSVRTIAGKTGVPVAVNGGFFAYGGAAVGAVKKGDWIRMPWKNRTAIGWDQLDKKTMGALQGTVSVSLGDKTLTGVTLNGMSSGYSFAKDNAFAVLTPRFGKEITVRPDQVVLSVVGGKVSTVYPLPNLVPVAPVPLPEAQPLPPDAAPVPPALQMPQTVKVAIPPNGWLLVCLNAARAVDLAAPVGTSASFDISVQPENWAQWPFILGAGPRLVADGQVKTTEVEEEFRPDVVARGPRSAVGWDAKGNWMILVADGRQPNSVGITLPETGKLFQEFGAVQAMNLDGGSSTQLVVNGELVNNPSGVDPVNLLRRKEVQVTNALTIHR